MSLPKIEYPIYNIEVPSLKKKFKFRPFLVKEEKILLMAKESQNSSDILLAVKQIINNCCLDVGLNFEQLAVFDLEYVFIKLRAVSVDNLVKVSYQDFEDNQSYDFEVDLNDVVVKFPEKIVNTIKISDQMGLIMKYPPATLYDDKEFLNLEKDYMFELIIKCIDKIYDGDSVYESKNYKKEEIAEFLESLGMQTFEEVQNFLLESPKIVHELNYKNSLGNDRKIILSSLNDFFTWR
jgi:hypothetical protein